LSNLKIVASWVVLKITEKCLLRQSVKMYDKQRIFYVGQLFRPCIVLLKKKITYESYPLKILENYFVANFQDISIVFQSLSEFLVVINSWHIMMVSWDLANNFCQWACHTPTSTVQIKRMICRYSILWIRWIVNWYWNTRTKPPPFVHVKHIRYHSLFRFCKILIRFL